MRNMYVYIHNFYDAHSKITCSNAHKDTTAITINIKTAIHITVQVIKYNYRLLYYNTNSLCPSYYMQIAVVCIKYTCRLIAAYCINLTLKLRLTVLKLRSVIC